KLIDEELTTGKLELPRSVDCQNLGWLLVGGLKSGRVGHLRPSAVRSFLEAAAKQPLRSSYAALLWVIENGIARFARTDQAMRYLRPMFDATLVGAKLAGQTSGRALVQLKALKAQVAGAHQHGMKSVPAGSRDEALIFICDWFENKVGRYLTICDQYFGPADLGIVALLRSTKPGCKLRILTSRRHQPKPPNGMTLEDFYTSYWKINIS